MIYVEVDPDTIVVVQKFYFMGRKYTIAYVKT